MGTGSFPGVKRPGRGADHQPPFSAEVKQRVELYIYSPSGPSWPVIGCTFTFITRRLPTAMERSKNIRRPYKRQFQQSSVCTGNATLICISRISYGSNVHPEHNTCLFWSKKSYLLQTVCVTAFWCSLHGFGSSIRTSWNLEIQYSISAAA